MRLKRGQLFAAEKDPGPPLCGLQRPKAKAGAGARGAQPDGDVSVDLTGKKAGRGAYLCPSAACLTKARKAKRLQNAFGVPVPDDVFERLTAEITAAEQAAKEAGTP